MNNINDRSNMQPHTSLFLAHAQYLLSLGLRPVLLSGKKPIFHNYNEYLAGPAGSDELTMSPDRRPLRYSVPLLEAWAREYPFANLGLLTADRPSIDVDSEWVWKQIKDLVPFTPHIKRGARGFTLIYSQDPHNPVLKTRTFSERFKREMLLEVLAHGRQTVLPPSIHPDNGCAYEWIAFPDFGVLSPTPLSHIVPPPLSQTVIDRIDARLTELGITTRRVPRGQGLARALAEGERRRYEAFVAPKLAERLAAVRGAVAGSRQDILNGACFALAPWVREGFIDETWLEAEMREACWLNGWIAADGDKAFTRQFSKALEDGWAAELPDLDAGRAAALMGTAPLLSGFPVSGNAGPGEGALMLAPEAVSDLLLKPPVPREWTVEGWIPHKQVTLVYGDGGTGKTTLLMQLAMVAAQGGRWFGMPVMRRKVLFISAEDEMSELQFRFQQMSKLLGADVPGLTVISLADLESAELMTMDGSVLRGTALLDAICDLVRAEGFDMVMMDPIADMFGGNDIEKRQVTKFMRTMRKRLAFDLDCTMVLAFHPSEAGIKTGKGTAGSVAWSNSSRSRLYFSRGEDKETLTLELMKANRAKLGTKIAMKWVNGVFVQVADEAKAIISAELELKIMVRLEREGPIYITGDRSDDWIGHMIGFEISENLSTREGRQKVRVLIDGWEKLGYVKKLEKIHSHRNNRKFIDFIQFPGVVGR